VDDSLTNVLLESAKDDIDLLPEVAVDGCSITIARPTTGFKSTTGRFTAKGVVSCVLYDRTFEVEELSLSRVADTDFSSLPTLLAKFRRRLRIFGTKRGLLDRNRPLVFADFRRFCGTQKPCCKRATMLSKSLSSEVRVSRADTRSQSPAEKV